VSLSLIELQIQRREEQVEQRLKGTADTEYGAATEQIMLSLKQISVAFSFFSGGTGM
jgi:hypothetical protein